MRRRRAAGGGRARAPKGLTSLAEAGAQGIRYVVDSDPYKQGRLTPVTHLPVVAPEQLQRRDPVDVLVLTALAYRDEIVAELRGPLGFRGTIAVVGYSLEAARSLGGRGSQEVQQRDDPGLGTKLVHVLADLVHVPVGDHDQVIDRRRREVLGRHDRDV